MKHEKIQIVFSILFALFVGVGLLSQSMKNAPVMASTNTGIQADGDILEKTGKATVPEIERKCSLNPNAICPDSALALMLKKASQNYRDAYKAVKSDLGHKCVVLGIHCDDADCIVQINTPTPQNQTTPVPTAHPNTAPSNPTAHIHNWQPVYREVEHPAVYNNVCTITEEEEYIQYDIKVFTCTDTGREWVWYSQYQSETELHAIIEEIQAWCRAQANLGGAGLYTTDEYHYYVVIPAEETCTNILIKEAWTERVYDHDECSCGATR